MALTPGTTLGPYEIVAPIGQGGMGEVYSATDTRLDRTVAIKVLPAELASDPDRRERFEREAKAIAALNHPHICTLHDVGHEDGTDFLVMEHLEGESLQNRLTKGALPLDQALQIAIQIADALDKAHRQGITHRDLKPGNIMLTKSGAKLLDFGLAKLKDVGAVGDQSTKLADSLTAQGTVLGTFHYMVPEQLEGQEADARSDIWAFGCVVYEMVTGQRAFEGTSQASLIHAIIGVDPRPMSSLQSMSPLWLDQLVRICLAKDADDRWQNSGDIGRQLALATDGSATRVAAVMPTTAADRPTGWQQALPLAMASLVLGGLVTGLAVWRLVRPDSSARQGVTRVSVDVDPGQHLSGGFAIGEARFGLQRPSRRSLALSPDGRQLVYVGSDGERTRLFRRPMDRKKATPIPGTEGASHPSSPPMGHRSASSSSGPSARGRTDCFNCSGWLPMAAESLGE